MHQEDDTDNLNKYHQDTIHLSGVCHIEEYTEYVDRQQRQDYALIVLTMISLKSLATSFSVWVFKFASPNPSVKARISAVITFINGGMETEK